MSSVQYHNTGKRKNAVARVWLTPGQGSISVNQRSLEDYFPREIWRMQVKQPLELCGLMGQYNVMANVYGGGLTGQAGAIRHGIARALLEVDPKLRGRLRKEGFLTRDSRIKERKKYGQKGARKRFQYSKR
ncbi:MAG TPA: 30S ribosomal protein S9 [Nitrospiria bacterium]|jgi:small subunit ribosomal protein S9|nr:30S ribosomal protein S9 [Nitrospiria bacterium]